MERSQKQKQVDHETSIADLPHQILTTIFSRLPARVVLACRFVCRSFFYLTTQDKDFPTLHSTKAQPALLVQFCDDYFLSKTLSLIHPEHDLSQGFGVLADIKPRLNIYRQNGSYIVVNSCNGLVCLKEKSTNRPQVVCNPLTGEYVILPAIQAVQSDTTMACGVGFCSNTETFKVLSIFRSRGLEGGSATFAQILSLGSSSWRFIGQAPFYPSGDANLVSLHGNLHWVCNDGGTNFVASFDFDSESFKEIPPPLIFGKSHLRRKGRMTVGVLDASLLICDAIRKGQFELWKMMEYGNQESWIKYLACKISAPRGSLQGLQWPLMHLEEGNIVMVADDNIIFRHDTEKGITRFFKFHGIHTQFHAISHTPTLHSLVDLLGDKVEVRNLTPLLAQQQDRGILDSRLVECCRASATQKRELPRNFFMNVSLVNIIKEWEGVAQGVSSQTFSDDHQSSTPLASPPNDHCHN